MIHCLRLRGKSIKLADFLGARVTFDHDSFNLEVAAELPVGKSDTKKKALSDRQAAAGTTGSVSMCRRLPNQQSESVKTGA